MAVDSRHLNLLCNREMITNNGIEGQQNIYSNAGVRYGVPMYGSESVPAKTMKAAESGLTYGSRKRSRDDFQNCNHLLHSPAAVSSYSFLGEDVSVQIQQQQLEIDHFIAQHNEKVRMEIEERRKRNYQRMLISAIEGSVMKKLKEKEEEIENIAKLNYALEERVRTLCYENEMWRDLAQMNEATGNALREKLEQALAQGYQVGGDTALLDDAQSCCGSNYEEDRTGQRRSLSDNVNSDGRMCRICGKGESCVLLLPCRHLSMCAVCGSSINICPVCKTEKNASLNINF